MFMLGLVKCRAFKGEHILLLLDATPKLNEILMRYDQVATKRQTGEYMIYA